eukprot:710099-Prorocentrum_minimum.AAC.1
MQAPKLKPRFKFQGHKDTVEDVAFNPFTEMELCSVGDDKTLLFWDSRAGTAPVLKGEKRGRFSGVLLSASLPLLAQEDP